MRTVALRFADNFAPECGTIAAHQQLMVDNGFVWYGKLGSPISKSVVGDIFASSDPKVLLIHSGKSDRWWAHIDSIQRETPQASEIPPYYRDRTEDFSCWLRVTSFEKAPDNVMSRCVVASSNKPLSLASRHSMSPYFIINYQDE